MNAVLATFLRELRAYFFSPIAYIVLFFLLAVNGAIFAVIVSFLTQPMAPPGPPFEYFFNNFYFWLLQLIVAPVLTMRLLAEERKSGSIEVLMTAPVTEGQVIAGKYLAAFVFYLFLWAPTALYAVLIDYYAEVDFGTLAASYLGLALVGALFLAIGVVASAMTRNQLVAAIVSFALIALIFLVVFLTNLVNDPTSKEVLGYLSVAEHMEDFSRGIVDTRRLVFYPTATLFLLWLAGRTLADKKWR